MRTKIYPVIIILSLIVLAFSPALYATYIQWDDGKHVTHNPLVYVNILTHFSQWITQHLNGTYIPLTTLSFNLEYHLFGLNPTISHGINILLHMGVALTIFVFMQRLGLTRSMALIGTLIVALHPLRVESVAWVTERKDMLYALFYLLSLLAYINYIHGQRRRILLLSLVFAVLSILAKPMAISLPLALCLLDWWFKRPFSVRLLIEKLPFAITIGGIALQTVLTLSPNPNVVWPDSFLIALWSLSFYLIKFVYPFPLLPIYTPPEPVALSTMAYAVALAVWAIVFISAWIFRRQRLVLFALGWWFFSIFFFARFDFADINIVADRFMYLPSLGFSALLGYALITLSNRPGYRPWVYGFAGLLILMLSVMTYQQTQRWQQDATLWQWVLKHEPNNSLARKKINILLNENPRREFDEKYYQDIIGHSVNKAKAYNERGLMLIAAGQHEMAMQDFNQAIKLSPQDAQGYLNRGSLWNWRGNNAQALADFNQSIKLDPLDALGFINRGIVYYQQHQFALALRDFNEALRLKPNATDAFYRRGLMWTAQEAWANAIEDFSSAIRLDPRHAQAYYQRALAYRQFNRNQESLSDLHKTIELNPHHPEALNELGAYYIQTNQLPLALTTLNDAINLDPYNHQLYVNRANTWLRLKEFDKARDDLTMAIQLSHKPWRYLITRGDIWMTQGKFEQARRDFKQAHSWEPTDTLSLFKMARAEYELGNFNNALTTLTKAIRLDPYDSNLFIARASVYRRLNHTDKAALDDHRAQQLESGEINPGK